jgi:hypothetical protein
MKMNGIWIAAVVAAASLLSLAPGANGEAQAPAADYLVVDISAGPVA